jgi:hypothetical protein
MNVRMKCYFGFEMAYKWENDLPGVLCVCSFGKKINLENSIKYVDYSIKNVTKLMYPVFIPPPFSTMDQPIPET